MTRAIAVALVCAACTVEAETALDVTQLVGARIFDGEEFREGTLSFTGARIVDGTNTRASETVDASGLWITPALVDAHTHRFAGAGDAEEARAMFVERGFVGAVNLCGPPDSRETAAPWLRDFDVRFTFGAITAPGAHPVPLYRSIDERNERDMETFFERNEGRVFHQVADVTELDAKLGALIRSGPDLVKFMLSPTLDPSLVRPLVERVHASGRRVVCHLDTRDQFARALEAGVDVLAHAPGYGARVGEDLAPYRLDESDAETAAAAGLVVIATAGAYEHRSDNSAARSVLRHNLRLLKDAGVTILFGSDDWFGPDTEWRALHALGVFSPTEVLAMVTYATPREMFPGADLGTLEPGALASFAAYDVDPRTVVDAMPRPVLVVRRGVVLLDRR